MINTITKTGNLPNQKPVNGKANPMECHTFFHAMTFIETYEPTEEYIEHKWSLEGEVPSKLTIDENGVISGKVLTFDLQENCRHALKPKEPLAPGGGNWLNNGRLNGPSYTFKFKVKKWIKYLVTPEAPTGTDTDSDPTDDATTEPVAPPEPYEEESEHVVDVNIIVISNNNIDNLMFVRNYMATGKDMKIEKTTYTIDNMEDFLKRHPGPFGCGE